MYDKEIINYSCIHYFLNSEARWELNLCSKAWFSLWANDEIIIVRILSASFEISVISSLAEKKISKTFVFKKSANDEITNPQRMPTICALVRTKLNRKNSLNLFFSKHNNLNVTSYNSFENSPPCWWISKFESCYDDYIIGDKTLLHLAWKMIHLPEIDE